MLVKLEQFRHARHNVGLRDRLVAAYRQSVIAVSATLQRFGNKEMPRHSPHRLKYFLIAHVVMVAQSSNHSLAWDRKLLRRLYLLLFG